VPQREQAAILDALGMPAGIAAVTAPRGRGKSALAGMLLNRIAGRRGDRARERATDVIARLPESVFALWPRMRCWPPRQADWLIVDEAAAIPARCWKSWCAFPVLLTTTVQGYEGTGRGFLLKFCARFAGCSATPYPPIRWAAGCPLERIVAARCCLTMRLSTAARKERCV
jgi:tRNA(Met) cytidine acetyltransferase